MDAGLIAFIAGMIGLLVGVLSMNAVARSERERERSLVSAPTLRDGCLLYTSRADHNVEDELGVLGEEDAGALAEGHFEGIERGVLAAGQGGIGPVIALGFVLVDDGY